MTDDLFRQTILGEERFVHPFIPADSGVVETFT